MDKLLTLQLPTWMRALQYRVAQALPENSLGARFARGALWTVCGTLVSQILGLLASMLTARILGKVKFGELAMIRNTLGMLGVVAGVGLGLTVTKYVAEYRLGDKARAGRIIALSAAVSLATGSAISLALFLFAPYFASRAINAPHLTSELRLACIWVLLSTVNGVQIGTLSGLEAFKKVAKVNVIRGVISFPVTLGGAYWGGLTGAIVSLNLVAALGWVLNHNALLSECRRLEITVHYENLLAEVPMLWGFSLPIFLSNLLVPPVAWVANAMLVNRENGYAEMGVFNAASDWATVVYAFSGLLISVILPMISNLSGSERVHEFRRAARFAVIGVAVVSGAACLALGAVAPFIMAAYGKGFTGHSNTLIAVLAAAVLGNTINVMRTVMVSRSHAWANLLCFVPYAVTLLIASAVLKEHGAFGRALANLLADFALFVIMGTYTYRLLRQMRGAPGGMPPTTLPAPHK